MSNYDPGLVTIIAVIWGLLAVASILVFILKKARPEKNYSELVKRTQSWWVMIGIFTAAFASGKNLSIWLFGIISFLALKEYFSMIPTRRADRRVLFWAYLSIPFQYYFVADHWYGMFIIFIPVYIFLFMHVRMLMIGQTEGFINSAGTIHWGLMVTVFAISHAAFLYTLPQHSNGGSGAGLLLFLVFLTQFNDVAQYTWGKLFGKHKVIPKVSPNKTWEGLVGGVVSVALMALVIAPYLTPFNMLYAFSAGLIISISGFFGDVTISALKRDIGVKDTGSTIPGHGGILDRIDSLTFSAPLFFHFTWYFFY
jgi:phosphatidate cytidylyltransferase